MSIVAITQQRFDSFQPARAPMANMIGEEKAWYADEHGTVIGAVIRDKTDNDWCYVVLTRADDEHFRWVDGNSSFATQHEADRELRAKMLENSWTLPFSMC